MKQTKDTYNKKFILKPSDRMMKLTFLGVNIYSSFYSGSTLIRKISFIKYKKTDISKLVQNKLDLLEKNLTKGTSLNNIDISELNKSREKAIFKSEAYSDFHISCEKAREKFGITNVNEFFNKLEKYNTGRIDIQSFGNDHNTIEIIDCDDDKANIKTLLNEKKDQGSGFAIQSVTGSISLKIKFKGDGILNIRLRGVDYKIPHNNNRLPIFINYSRFSVDSEELIGSDAKIVSHDTPFYFKKQIKDGQIVSINLNWSPV